MAKRIKAGKVQVKVTNSDQDGNTIQFEVKFKPKQHCAMLTSGRGLCLSKNNKHYIRFEDSLEVQGLLTDIRFSMNSDFKDNLPSITSKIKGPKKRTRAVNHDITNYFSTDLDGTDGLVLYPSQYSKFAAYNIAKFMRKDCKAKDIENYADANYRITVSVGTLKVTVVDEDPEVTTYVVEPYINVSLLTLCIGKGQKSYDPDVIRDVGIAASKAKELSDLKSFFSGGPKKLRLGFTDTGVVKVKDPNELFSDGDDAVDAEEEEGYEKKTVAATGHERVYPFVVPVLADADPAPPAKRQKKAKKVKEAEYAGITVGPNP
jgi:hypothetical protein